MSRIEIAYRILLAVADDYEDRRANRPLRSKRGWANVAKDELLSGLGDLIQDGLVDSLIYDKQLQEFRAADGTGTSPEFWYCISDKESNFLR